jgi:hypothetical protein
MKSFKNGDLVRFEPGRDIYRVFDADSIGGRYERIWSDGKHPVGYKSDFYGWGLWESAVLVAPDCSELSSQTSSTTSFCCLDFCPKCGSKDVQWVSLALKCNECWCVF